MGLNDFSNKVSGDDAVKKEFKGSLALLAKQDRTGRLMEKRINISPAENGFVLSVNMEVEFGDGKDRDWRFFEKKWIHKDIKGAVAQLEKELIFTPGQKIKMSDIMSTKNGQVRAVAKRQLTFTTGDGDGHVHVANGDIMTKTKGGELVKTFQGDTLANAVYWKMGEPEKGSNDTEFTRKVAKELVAHTHKFKIKLTKGDESGWRIYGQTDKQGEHSHPVDILDFKSIPVSNSPDR